MRRQTTPPGLALQFFAHEANEVIGSCLASARNPEGLVRLSPSCVKRFRNVVEHVDRFAGVEAAVLLGRELLLQVVELHAFAIRELRDLTVAQNTKTERVEQFLSNLLFLFVKTDVFKSGNELSNVLALALVRSDSFHCYAQLANLWKDVPPQHLEPKLRLMAQFSLIFSSCAQVAVAGVPTDTRGPPGSSMTLYTECIRALASSQFLEHISRALLSIQEAAYRSLASGRVNAAVAQSLRTGAVETSGCIVSALHAVAGKQGILDCCWGRVDPLYQYTAVSPQAFALLPEVAAVLSGPCLQFLLGKELVAGKMLVTLGVGAKYGLPETYLPDFNALVASLFSAGQSMRAHVDRLLARVSAASLVWQVIYTRLQDPLAVPASAAAASCTAAQGSSAAGPSGGSGAPETMTPDGARECPVPLADPGLHPDQHRQQPGDGQLQAQQAEQQQRHHHHHHQHQSQRDQEAPAPGRVGDGGTAADADACSGRERSDSSDSGGASSSLNRLSYRPVYVFDLLLQSLQCVSLDMKVEHLAGGSQLTLVEPTLLLLTLVWDLRPHHVELRLGHLWAKVLCLLRRRPFVRLQYAGQRPLKLIGKLLTMNPPQPAFRPVGRQRRAQTVARAKPEAVSVAAAASVAAHSGEAESGAAALAGQGPETDGSAAGRRLEEAGDGAGCLELDVSDVEVIDLSESSEGAEAGVWPRLCGLSCGGNRADDRCANRDCPSAGVARDGCLDPNASDASGSSRPGPGASRLGCPGPSGSDNGALGCSGASGSGSPAGTSGRPCPGRAAARPPRVDAIPYSLRCALDNDFVPTLEQYLRDLSSSRSGAGDELGALAAVTFLLRRPGVWPSMLAHAPPAEMASLVLTLRRLAECVKLRLKASAKNPWMSLLVGNYQDADIAAMSYLAALLEQSAAMLLQPRPQQQQPQAGLLSGEVTGGGAGVGGSHVLRFEDPRPLELNWRLEGSSNACERMDNGPQQPPKQKLPPQQRPRPEEHEREPPARQHRSLDLRWMEEAGGRPALGSAEDVQLRTLTTFGLAQWLPEALWFAIVLDTWYSRSLCKSLSRWLLECVLQSLAAKLRGRAAPSGGRDAGPSAAAPSPSSGPKPSGCLGATGAAAKAACTTATAAAAPSAPRLGPAVEAVGGAGLLDVGPAWAVGVVAADSGLPVDYVSWMTFLSTDLALRTWLLGLLQVDLMTNIGTRNDDEDARATGASSGGASASAAAPGSSGRSERGGSGGISRDGAAKAGGDARDIRVPGTEGAALDARAYYPHYDVLLAMTLDVFEVAVCAAPEMLRTWVVASKEEGVTRLPAGKSPQPWVDLRQGLVPKEREGEMDEAPGEDALDALGGDKGRKRGRNGRAVAASGAAAVPAQQEKQQQQCQSSREHLQGHKQDGARQRVAAKKADRSRPAAGPAASAGGEAAAAGSSDLCAAAPAAAKWEAEIPTHVVVDDRFREFLHQQGRHALLAVLDLWLAQPGKDTDRNLASATAASGAAAAWPCGDAAGATCGSSTGGASSLDPGWEKQHRTALAALLAKVSADHDLANLRALPSPWTATQALGAAGVLVCANPTCAVVSITGDGGAPTPGGHKVCKRCGVATYCSGACQLAHWKGAHQEECGKHVATTRARTAAAEVAAEARPQDGA